MPTKPWSDMTPKQRAAALSEKLGWVYVPSKTEPPYSGGSGAGHTTNPAHWVADGKRIDDWDCQTWPGMGLVVEAMEARSLKLSISFSSTGAYMIEFVHWDFSPYPLEPPIAEPVSEPVKAIHSSQWPAATAGAAYRALGGE